MGQLETDKVRILMDIKDYLKAIAVQLKRIADQKEQINVKDRT